MLANWLARLGVSVVIIDTKNGPTKQSRAIGVQARTMEIYDQLGLINVVLSEARAALAVEPGYERTRFGVVRFASVARSVTPYPWLCVLEQSRTETILHDNLRRLGAEVLWNTALEFVDAEPDGSVSAVPTGGRLVRARFCVGADGRGSVLRSLLGIDFEGETTGNSFFVCDARDARGLTEDVISVRFGDRDFLLTFPLESVSADTVTGPPGQRIIGLLPTGLPGAVRSKNLPSAEALVRGELARVYGVEWCTAGR